MINPRRQQAVPCSLKSNFETFATKLQVSPSRQDPFDRIYQPSLPRTLIQSRWSLGRGNNILPQKTRLPECKSSPVLFVCCNQVLCDGHHNFNALAKNEWSQNSVPQKKKTIDNTQRRSSSGIFFKLYRFYVTDYATNRLILSL